MTVMRLVDIHEKIKEVSGRHIASYPTIYIHHLAIELKTDRSELLSDLQRLERLGIIEFQDKKRLTISLTDQGKR